MQRALSIMLRLRRLITIVLGEADPPLPRCAFGDWFTIELRRARSTLCVAGLAKHWEKHAWLKHNPQTQLAFIQRWNAISLGAP
jgi:hypothetical protein